MRVDLPVESMYVCMQQLNQSSSQLAFTDFDSMPRGKESQEKLNTCFSVTMSQRT